MKSKYKIIAVVPARGGSKGVPRKNIKNLNGKPLIFYVLKTLCETKKFDKIIVSTEDEEITKVVKKLKLNVIISKRPKYLAEDKTPLTSVVHYESKKLYNKGYKHDFVFQVSAASPFISKSTIVTIVDKILSKKSDCIVTLKKIEHEHPYRAKELYSNNFFKPFIKNINVEKFISRQDLPLLYCTSGAIYARSFDLLMSFNSKDFCLGKKPMGVVVDDIEATNIDRPIDFEFAKFLSKRK